MSPEDATVLTNDMVAGLAIDQHGATRHHLKVAPVSPVATTAEKFRKTPDREAKSHSALGVFTCSTNKDIAAHTKPPVTLTRGTPRKNPRMLLETDGRTASADT